jgi:hypothetical protein
MTIENMVLVMMTSFNFLLLVFLLVVTLRENNRRRQLLVEDRENFYASLSSLSEKMNKVEVNTVAPTASSSNENSKTAKFEGRESVKIALQKLKIGKDPETIGKEMGLSRSEMGILLASAKRSS